MLSRRCKGISVELASIKKFQSAIILLFYNKTALLASTRQYLTRYQL